VTPSDAPSDTAAEERAPNERPAPTDSSEPSNATDQARSHEAGAAGSASAEVAGAREGVQHRRRRRRRRRSGPPPGAMRQMAEAGADAPATEATGNPTAAETPESGEGGAQRQTLHLRHWRRRHRRARPMPRLGSAEGGGALAGESATGDETTNGSNNVTGGQQVPGEVTPMRPRHRRRRTRYPLVERASGADGEPTTAEGAPAEAGAEMPTRPLGTRPPRSRNRRRRRRPNEAAANAAAPAGQGAPRREGEERSPDRGSDRAPRKHQHDRERERDRGARDGAGRPDRRDDRRGSQREGQRDRGRRGPPGRERGRGMSERKAPPKLYSFDSVVDRGFEDVEGEGETKRVHWTIVKRTTADQISRKPMSAVYVLQRDGDDTEFPNLGAARSAVNKTIVHPEKLTRSKEEYAAEKSAKR